MDGLPWPAITAASGGWILLGIAVTMLLTGKGIVSSREARSYLTRAEKAEADNVVLVRAVADLTAVGRLQKAYHAAQQEAAAMLEAEDTDGAAAGGGG